MSGKKVKSVKSKKSTVSKPKHILTADEVETVKPSQFEAPIFNTTTPYASDTYDNKMQSFSKFSSKVLIVLFLVALVGAGYTFKLYKDSQDQVKKLKNPQEVAKVETQQLVDAVGKLIAIPKETPTIATVVDVKKLKNQPFFAKASNGDKVLIFTQSKKAILYNPKSNKIIEVAPINIGQNKDGGVAGESTVLKVSPTKVLTPTSKPSPTTESSPTPSE